MAGERDLTLILGPTSGPERAALRSAVLAARATELAELRRWTDRRAFGYGSDSARGAMVVDIDRLKLRHEMLGRLLDALSDNGT